MFYRLDVYHHECVLAYSVLYVVLYVLGLVVCLVKAYAAVHAHVHVYRLAVAYLSGAQVVRVGNAGAGEYDAAYFVLNLFGQRVFYKLAKAGAQLFYGCVYYEQAHDKGCNGVEHRPMLAQQQCAADADGGSY